MTAEDGRDTPERGDPDRGAPERTPAERGEPQPEAPEGEDAGRGGPSGKDRKRPDPNPENPEATDPRDPEKPEATDPPDPGKPPEDQPETADDALPEPPGGADDEPSAAEGGTAPRPRRRLRSRIATTVSVFGEILITLGLLMALFVAYSLWWTNIQANREAKRQSEKVREHWAAEGPGGSDRSTGPLDLKNGIGFLHVPSMLDEAILVKKGTDSDSLNQGVAGYYEKPTKAAMPWDQSGNFSLAAHRDGHGAKFHNIHKIDEGDPLVFETKNTWYVYKAYATLPKTSKYNVDVLDPIPEESGKKEAGRYITLTTCTPIFTSSHRYIVWGELVRTEPVDPDRTPPKELR